MARSSTRVRIEALEQSARAHRARAAAAARAIGRTVHHGLASADALSLGFSAGLVWGLWAPRPKPPRERAAGGGGDGRRFLWSLVRTLVASFVVPRLTGRR